MSERKTLTYSSSGSIKTHKALPAHTHQHQHTNIYSQTHISCVCCTQYKRCCSLPFVIELICYFLLLRRHRRCCFSPYLHTYVFFFGYCFSHLSNTLCLGCCCLYVYFWPNIDRWEKQYRKLCVCGKSVSTHHSV